MKKRNRDKANDSLNKCRRIIMRALAERPDVAAYLKARSAGKKAPTTRSVLMYIDLEHSLMPATRSLLGNDDE